MRIRVWSDVRFREMISYSDTRRDQNFINHMFSSQKDPYFVIFLNRESYMFFHCRINLHFRFYEEERKQDMISIDYSSEQLTHVRHPEHYVILVNNYLLCAKTSHRMIYQRSSSKSR